VGCLWVFLEERFWEGDFLIDFVCSYTIYLDPGRMNAVLSSQLFELV
jgi:hypothetical protein